MSPVTTTSKTQRSYALSCRTTSITAKYNHVYERLLQKTADFFCFIRWHGLQKKLSKIVTTRIRFEFPSVATNRPGWITHGYINHHKFNIDYYPGVDSVFLSVWARVPKAGNKGTIELYNITDSVPIPGSLIDDRMCKISSTAPGCFQNFLWQAGNRFGGRGYPGICKSGSLMAIHFPFHLPKNILQIIRCTIAGGRSTLACLIA